MNYYKFISDGNIIDAVEAPVWIKQDKRGNIVRCDIKEAMGVLSSDMSTVLHIAGAKEFSGETFTEISVADITADEYEELKVLLNLGAEVPDEGEVEWKDEETEPDEIPEDATLAEVKTRCLAKLSDDCQNTIYAGVDVQMSDGSVRHFALEIEDQLNLLTLSTLIASGATSIPYHASDELCTYYSVEDILKITETATAFKTYHTSYYNSLKNWILSMKTIAEVGAVKYGDPIPAEYCSDVLIGMIETISAEGEAVEETD